MGVRYYVITSLDSFLSNLKIDRVWVEEKVSLWHGLINFDPSPCPLVPKRPHCGNPSPRTGMSCVDAPQDYSTNGRICDASYLCFAP